MGVEYQWHDFVGNIGIVLIVASYLALQLGKTDAKKLSYSLANGFGALLILISLIYNFNL